VGDGAEKHVQQRLFALEQVEFVLIAQDFVPAMGALKGVAHVGGMGMGMWPVGRGFVQEARLRDANSRWNLVPGDQVQERSLQCQRQFRVQVAIKRRTPKDQAAGSGQQMKLASQVCLAHACGEAAKRPKRQQVLDAGERRTLAPAQWFSPRRQWLFLPEIEQRLVVREYTEAGVVPVVDMLAIDSTDQSREEHIPRVGRRFLLWRGEETLPKCFARTLLAVAIERPKHAALVVQCARKSQRQQNHAMTVRHFR